MCGKQKRKVHLYRILVLDIPLDGETLEYWLIQNCTQGYCGCSFALKLLITIQFLISSNVWQLLKDGFVSERVISWIISVLTKYRNVCAHGERLFTYRTVDVIADTPLHKKLSLLQSGNQYEKGKQDFSEKVVAKPRKSGALLLFVVMEWNIL